MTTEKQIEANRQNAQESTGPKTALGKRHAALNALKHGLRAEAIVIPGEDPEEFEALHEGLRASLKPSGSLEDLLTERIAICLWRLRRITKIETAIIRYEHLQIEINRAMDQVRALSSSDEPDDFFAIEEEDFPERDENADDPEAYACAVQELRAKEAELESGLQTLFRTFHEAHWSLERLLRYETAVERSLRSSMRELQALQAARGAKTEKPSNVIDVESSSASDS